jgi:phosphomannomutase
VVLANDPDADRLAVAFPDPVTGEWTRLSGDELGVLLGDRLLARTTGDDRVVATSIVSASWLARVAAAHGVPCRTTLTGFKWLSRAGDADGRRLVFAYEEALGYAVTDAVRDKDGITAAVAVAELAAELRATGRTVFDEIAELAARHGGSATAQLSVRYDGTDALSQMRQLMERLRASEPEHVGGRTVRRTIDVLDGLVRDGSGRTERSDLPSADVLVWELEGDARVIVRPSGTEPKLKCYLEVPLRPAEPTRDDLARARADSDRALARLRAAAEHLLRV